MERDKKIIKISIWGILVNAVLVVFKMIVGLIANSIAIVLDAVNNLSDVLSSVITIIGVKLSRKKPDKKHPYGHGRIEYFSSVIIAIIVMAAGITALKESVEGIISPADTNYSIISSIVIIVAVIVKFVLGFYVKKEGKILNSGSLIASGTDAISDAYISLSTLVAIVVNTICKINLEGYLGIIISILILKSSIEILSDTLNKILGTRTDRELTGKLKKEILQYDKVQGVYDITVHNYGPSKNIATVHIEVDDNMPAKEIHRLTRKITMGIYEKLGIIITVGIYASNDGEDFEEIKSYVVSLIKNYKNIIQLHAFYVDEELKNISFDVVFNFEENDAPKITEEIKDDIMQKYKGYKCDIIIDTDFSVEN